MRFCASLRSMSPSGLNEMSRAQNIDTDASKSLAVGVSVIGYSPLSPPSPARGAILHAGYIGGAA
jgi:hypothetical protein